MASWDFRLVETINANGTKKMTPRPIKIRWRRKRVATRAPRRRRAPTKAKRKTTTAATARIIIVMLKSKCHGDDDAKFRV